MLARMRLAKLPEPASVLLRATSMIGLLIRLIILAIESSASPRQPVSPPVPRMIGPRILSAVTLRQFPLSFGQALLLTNIVADGPVQYSYILAVQDFDGSPSMFVASESNTASTLGKSGSHCLSVFTPEGYENLGGSDAWGDLELFQAEAVKLIKGYLGLT